ncbi:MAG: ROK family glucokinase [Lachnoclostridium edouardi]|uniref:ROK family glucokinase n=1 Tax=Lachnoclostridium edouardi TaxID=1926283 RepID=UPI0026DC6CBF|nr:ROK family glucokinase [Lachnoclostridium edouardi]MDO4277871.1 ROK family glucokinase [Lachnoclostridium edouardi]
MKKKCIGIDIGGTSVKIGLFELDGTLVDKWEVPTSKENNGESILKDIAVSIKAKLKEKALTLTDIAGAGMGLPGPVSQDGYVEVCVNLGWRDRYPERELSQLLDGILVKSGNDANVAALGEMWQGGGKGVKDLVTVTLGTGVGGGVILNEKIVSGSHGVGGEIGHIHVRDGETERCNCGGIGCLEQVASATGIAREARRMMATSGEPSLLREKGDQVTAKDVLDAAKAGDRLADAVVETASRYLGLVLAQVSMTVDPERFVIGGGVSKAGDFLIERIWKYYDFYTPISKNKASIGLALLGNDAGIYGAARLILD